MNKRPLAVGPEVVRQSQPCQPVQDHSKGDVNSTESNAEKPAFAVILAISAHCFLQLSLDLVQGGSCLFQVLPELNQICVLMQSLGMLAVIQIKLRIVLEIIWNSVYLLCFHPEFHDCRVSVSSIGCLGVSSLL